mmetsp:Transcript_13888/g.19886  ORF Transcript_13888/g.19886 Transcript_13888/m.19886 type:complete len:404 (-) Transcript_13888:2165-3376(-)
MKQQQLLFICCLRTGLSALFRGTPAIRRSPFLPFLSPKAVESSVQNSGYVSSTASLAFMSSSSEVRNNEFKRFKVSHKDPSLKVIGTHSGTFQADEALGVWLLRQLPAYYQSKVVRTRDDEMLKDLDIVLDVGGIYNHDTLRYDHHQRGFEEFFSPHHTVTKLSASGLIYKHYGKEVIQAYYPYLSGDNLELAYVKMYNKFMEAIDAIDTGVEISKHTAYKDSTGLSSRISRLNPKWNESEDDETYKTPDQRFEVASQLAGEDFLGVLENIVESEIPAYNFVEQAVIDRFNVYPTTGEIIKLESGGMPWKSHIYDIERKHKVEIPIKFVLYTDQANMWRVQAVSEEGSSFTNRLGLPEHWRGIRGEDLSAIAKIPGCTFCHQSGFIGGNETFEGALKMAIAAL